VRWARRASAIAPDDERALATLIRLLAASGDRMGALNTYEAFRIRLREQYQVAPSPETTALLNRILNT
jgi:DNA-binding SARP family transcriptional activator